MNSKITSFIELDARAATELKRYLKEKKVQQPIRIELQFSGCCDPSLGLKVDQVRDTDLVQQIEELQFVMDQKNHDLAGKVSISYVTRDGSDGFIVTSDRPVSEWDGFEICQIVV